jgi:glutamine amidotransferase
MLVAFGKLSMPQLLDDFKQMAQNRNERHELNKDNPNYLHSSGWGIVVGKAGKLKLYKKEVPCWEDPKFLNYYDIDADLVILHARKASVGREAYANTHPFEGNNWYFCHNGTMYDFKSQEKTDSEQFFMLVLEAMKRGSNIKEAFVTTANQIKEYSAINAILVNSEKAYVMVKHNMYPVYYTMKYLKSKDYAIVSSECLPSFKGKWTKIDNNTIVTVSANNQKIESQSI